MRRYHSLGRFIVFVTLSLLLLLLAAFTTPVFAQERVRVSGNSLVVLSIREVT